MKIERFILLLLTICCISCDYSKPFVIDGEKKYVLFSECGRMEIGGSSLFSRAVFITCTFSGNYLINTDSLKIKAFSNRDTICDICFTLNDEYFTGGNKIEIKNSDVLDLSFEVSTTRPLEDKKVLLLPSDFIMCGDKPIITDTITIALK
ncbi:hypothetical protein [Bacteroides sp. UBA939]|uniref:hypothetical protein n=1 Tax=Bacteroides sp. UBA939 TaxID=1946092 RepID=UPI0025B9E52C|nr:hypothetical protein [Bacteroides sp. UBA939]